MKSCRPSLHFQVRNPNSAIRNALARSLSFAVLALLSAYCLLPSAFGQSATATLSGTVEDQNKAVVPGAKVKAINLGTGLERESVTNDSGDFTIPLLPPSAYTVRVERDGFTTVEISDVILNVGDQKTLQIQLKAGNISEMVKIEGNASLINESPAVGTIVDRQFVENIPLNGRSFQTLIALSPGVVLTRANSDAQGQFSVNGQRANANYFMIDGVGANIGVSPGTNVGGAAAGNTPGLAATGGTNNLISVDALQEFTILTSSFAPEFGRTPGGQVQILTRSGTNDYHGTIFEYFRNEALDAAEWFRNANRLGRAPLRQHNFGGVFGGPLPLPRFGEGGPTFIGGKNRTFFFFSHESLRLKLPRTALTRVPTVGARNAASPAMRALLNAFPLPNGRDLGNNLAEFNATFADPSSLDATSLRIDYHAGDRVTLFGRFNYSPSRAETRLGFASSVVRKSVFRTMTLTGGATVIFSPAISNDIRLNYSNNRGRSFSTLDNFGGAVPPDEGLLFSTFGSSDTGSTNISISGGVSGLSLGVFGYDEQRQINIVDTLSVLKGAHQLKFGVDYRRLFPYLERSRYTPQYIFSSVTSAVNTGRTLASSISAYYGPVYPVFNNLSIFGQDTWKATKRLTLTYGSRWDLNPPPTEANGNAPFPLTGIGAPSTLALAPAGTPLYQTTYGNFAPRIGVAYQLSQRNGRETVLRGGFGVFYDLGTGSVITAFVNGFPYRFIKRPPANSLFPFDSTLLSPPPRNLNCPCGTVQGAVDPDFKLPYTYQWNVSVEQSIGKSQTVSATYVGAAGRRLIRQESLSNPNANFTTVNLTQNSGSSDYNALQLQFQRRLSAGLQALASYTWAKSLDNVSEDHLAEAPDFIIDIGGERGPSDFDVRHAFNAGVTYDLPSPRHKYLKAIVGGFSLDGTFAARTAFPVNVITGDPFAGVFNVSRPDLVPGVPIYLFDSQFPGGRRINRDAFTIPVNRQGNLPRNSVRNFPMWQLDLALRRQFNLTEQAKLQIRAEVFNVFNHPNFFVGDLERRVNNPNTFGIATTMLAGGLGSGGSGGGFNPLYQVGGPRSVQLAVKLAF